MAVSTDNGETFSDGVTIGADPGRIYDVVTDGKKLPASCSQTNTSSEAGPEHVYKVYKADRAGPLPRPSCPSTPPARGTRAGVRQGRRAHRLRLRLQYHSWRIWRFPAQLGSMENWADPNFSKERADAIVSKIKGKDGKIVELKRDAKRGTSIAIRSEPNPAGCQHPLWLFRKADPESDAAPLRGT